jgi:hypothetical protein
MRFGTVIILQGAHQAQADLGRFLHGRGDAEFA